MMRNTLFLLTLLYSGFGNASDELMKTSPCPGLVSSYDAAEFELALVVTDTEFTSIEDCEQLGGFYFDQYRASNFSVNYSQLDAIVDEIWQPVNEEAPFLLMEAFLSWLKGMGFERHAESVREFLDEYMPAQESVALFFTIVIWLIVIATVAMILHEFYRAGMLKLPGFQRRQAAIEKVERKPVMQLDQIRTLPLREQISALLQYSIEHLVNSNLLPSSRSLTNRELISYLEKSDVQKAGLLREQIDITEPVIYGDESISDQLIEACLLKTRGLSGA